MSNPGQTDFQYQTGEYYQPPMEQPQMAPSNVDPNQQYPQQYPEQIPQQYPQQYPSQQTPMNNQQYPQGYYPQQTPMNQQYVDPNQQYVQQQPQMMPQAVDGQQLKQMDYSPDSDNYSIDKAIRRGFIVKTYGILISQLFITLCFIFLGFNDAVSISIRKHLDTHYTFIIIALIAMTFILLTFFCCRETARKTPINYILLFAFTLCMSYYCLILTSFFEVITVIFALGLTIMSTLGLTLYAWKTKTDYTYCGFFLFSFLFILIFCGLFFPLGIFFGLNPRVEYYFCTIGGIIIYSLYIIYDTQLILGEFGLKYKIDDYVLAALNLYIDIIYLFIKILQIVGKLKQS